MLVIPAQEVLARPSVSFPRSWAEDMKRAEAGGAMAK